MLDADIFGPSQPKMFNVEEARPYMVEVGGRELIEPAANYGVKLLSIGFFVNKEDAVLWRGAMASNALKQLIGDANWGELDYLFVDMPPGTGDVALTVFQSLPIDGIVIVSTPQDLVKMIVNKAYNMAKMMNVPVLGLVENMSYYICPNCNEKINIFGESKIEETAGELGVPVLAKLPINPEINKLVDAGKISEVEAKELDDFVELLK